MDNPPGSGASSTPYWYEVSDPTVGLLHALRRFRQADQRMRRRMSSDMDLNATDVEALRHIIAHHATGEAVTARGLATHLDISTASTAKLLNRLTESGHVQRRPHPDDRRSVIVTATEHAHAEIREWLTDMHRRMLEIAHSVPHESRQAVTDFLQSMADCLDPEAVDDTPDR
ncbi:MarR family winged helix-turn-helix transcriptional regulator [Citricoccus alkalitolerans]|uniref:MarR family winged helix-turn-helix transcriptional regulator n=1 Tax=Citricoccus alkalitolerans TaxID=246603 RepID=A0ABV8XZF0_9MICC